MLLHYHQKTFEAAASGCIIKEVVCEQCQLRYYYQMTRLAVGSGIAPYGMGQVSAEANAEHEAKMRLRDALESDCEAVACPGCGRVQQQAIDYIRRYIHRHWYPNLRVLVWVLPLLGLFLTGLFLLVARREEPGHLAKHWSEYLLAMLCWIGLWFLLRASRHWLIARGDWLQRAIRFAPPALLPQSAASATAAPVAATSAAQEININHPRAE